MPDRTRGYQNVAPKGTAVWYFGNPSGLLVAGGDYSIGVEDFTCQDVVNEPDNGPFHVHTWKLDGGRINGRAPDTTVWTNYIADIFGTHSNFVHNRPADSPDNLTAATKGAAMTNPSRPEVDLPVDLLQMGETFNLIRDGFSSLANHGADFVGRNSNLLGFAGRAHLTWIFGVKPLMQDLVNLLHLKNSLNKRIKELERLHSGKGLRRTVTVFKGSTTSTDSAPYQTNGGFFSGSWDLTTIEEVRVHCRWYPSATFFPFDADDGDRVAQARRALLGMTASNWSTYWEALPWSWLIDWGSGVGDFFQANRNVVNASLGSVTVMRHTRSEYSFRPSNRNGDAQCGSARVLVDDKDRVLSTVFPTATMPILSDQHIGLASAISVRRL